MDDRFSHCFSELRRSELLLDLAGLNPEFRIEFNRLCEISSNALIKSPLGTVIKGNGSKVVFITLDHQNGCIRYEYDDVEDCINVPVQENSFDLISYILLTLIINNHD